MQRKSIFTSADGQNYTFTFILVTSLFLLWGFCNGMIDVMDKHFQTELHLTLSQSAWVQFAHYLGYFLMSLPAGWLASRLGYKGGIIAGLLLVSAGGFWFVPATHIAEFWAFLVGVCVIASGLTFLETVANPYTTVLGDQAYSATRINLAQSCNGIGWLFGPIAGKAFFYSSDASGNSTGSQTLYIPYVAVAVVVLVLAGIFLASKIPDITTEDDYHLDDPEAGASRSIWSHRHFTMAVAAQFFYVAAQAGIFGFFINYLTSQPPSIPESWNEAMTGFGNNWHAMIAGVWPHAPGLLTNFFLDWVDKAKDGRLVISDGGASALASVGFLFFLTGRFTGASLLKRFSAHKMLGVYGLLNVAMALLIFFKLAWLSLACLFMSYFFMSIMFPTIFALGIFGLGIRSKKASAFIVMAIMGGALLPKLMGYIADKSDISRGFIVPAFCFAFVAWYAFNWPKFSGAKSLTGIAIKGGH